MRVIPLHDAKLVVRPIPGYPGYAATLDGRVLSLPRVVARKNGVPMTIRGGECKRREKKYGSYVHLGNLATMCPGRAMLLAFIGQPPTSRHECCHGDGDFRNDSLSNLRWCTRAENMADMVRHGTQYCGLRHHSLKLNPAKVRKIRRMRAEGMSMRQLGRDFGVNLRAIQNIFSGRAWRNVR